MNWLTTAQIPIIILVLWIFTAYMTRSFPTLQGKRILLLIAHPDDEAMFFSPTLLWLTRPELGNILVILCLSSGDADGLGGIRKKELTKSAMKLGIRSEEHVVVVEDKNFPDSMTENWDPKLISQMLGRLFAPNMASTPTNQTPTAAIDAIITFDEGGVSGHPNHISLFKGAVTFLQSLMQRHREWKSPVKLYTLTTTNVVRKYSSMLDSVATTLACIFSRKEKGEFPTPLMMMSLAGDIRKGQQAMTTAHKSQMRWFRWGWIGVSRYMIMNDLRKYKGF